MSSNATTVDASSRPGDAIRTTTAVMDQMKGQLEKLVGTLLIILKLHQVTEVEDSFMKL